MLVFFMLLCEPISECPSILRPVPNPFKGSYQKIDFLIKHWNLQDPLYHISLQFVSFMWLKFALEGVCTYDLTPSKKKCSQKETIYETTIDLTLMLNQVQNMMTLNLYFYMTPENKPPKTIPSTPCTNHDPLMGELHISVTSSFGLNLLCV